MKPALFSRPMLSRVLGGLVLLSVVLAALEIGRRIGQGDVHVQVGFLCLGALCLAPGYLALAWGFQRLIARAVTDPPGTECRELYFRSLLARYLPGKVGIPAVRAAGAASLGVSTEFMLTGVVLDSLSFLATGGVLGVALALGPWSFLNARLAASPWAAVVPLLAVLSVVTLMIVDCARFPAPILRRLRLQGRVGPLLPWELVLANGLLWVATSLACAAIALSLGADAEGAFLAAGAGVLSQLVGFLALPVPAGLGVREAVLVMALSPSLGPARALAFGLVTRAVSLGCEVVLWLASRAILRWRAA